MKRFFYYALAISVMATSLTSCEDPILPTVDFSFSPTEVEIYDEVTFTNISTDADTYSWNFGDGESSTEENPKHTYKSGDTYIVTLTATNEDGSKEISNNVVVTVPANFYSLNDVTYDITTDFFWYQSSMGGDPYIRLLTDVMGQDNPDLIKLYPNSGVNTLPGTYSWDAAKPVNSYDAGYTADYAGMSFEWTAIGKTGSDNLIISELDTDVYRIEADIILSVGSYDYTTGVFTETGTKNFAIQYIGDITPLTK